MPENKSALSKLAIPPPGAPPTQKAKLNYVPFSFEEVPPRLPEKDDYGRFHDATLRDYCDKLDALHFHALTSNLIQN
jgi:hypothetical protein